MWWKKIFYSAILILSCLSIPTSCTDHVLNTQVFNVSGNSSTAIHQRIALLLPLDGVFMKQAEAICNGFFAAYYQANKKWPTSTIIVFNTTEKNINTVYQEALRQGATTIVGPLIKNHLVALVNAHTIKIPTLALNSLTFDSNPDNLFQFSLSPIDEAIAVAIKMRQDQCNRVIIITPRGEWVTSIANAFQTQWQSLGGQITARLTYKNNVSVNHDIRRLLNIDRSEQRECQLRQLLREKMRFIPRRRKDFDAIFLVANSSQARRVVPLFRFYYADDVLIYATSAVYSPSSHPIDNYDINGVRFSDMPWIVAPEQLSPSLRQIRQRIRILWPNSFNQYPRLYALGIDAYHIIFELAKLISISHYIINGATGNLYLLPNQRVYRQLLWVKIVNEQPQIYK